MLQKVLKNPVVVLHFVKISSLWLRPTGFSDALFSTNHGITSHLGYIVFLLTTDDQSFLYF